MTQAPESAGARQPVSSESPDSTEWRELGRKMIQGLPAFAVSVLVLLGVMYLWELAEKRYPWVPDLRQEVLFPLLVAAAWSWQVVAAFRNGRRRLASSGN